MRSRSHAWLAALALLSSGAALAGAQLQVYFQSNLTQADYQQKVFAKVSAAWQTPAKTPPPGKKAVVQAVLDRGGKLLSAVVSTSSGVKAWDDAALAAVKRAAPFERLPAGFKPDSVEVHFHLAWTK